MLFYLGTISPFFAFQHSDYFGRLIAILLLYFSVISWFLMMDKWLIFKVASMRNKEVIKSLNGNLFFYQCLRSSLKRVLSQKSMKADAPSSENTDRLQPTS